jgi:hypothetical protein
MRPDIVPGATFPDYELPDHTETPRKLSEIQGDDPMILTLARGHYCPKEHQQHLELAANYPKINRAHTHATRRRDPLEGAVASGEQDVPVLDHVAWKKASRFVVV